MSVILNLQLPNFDVNTNIPMPPLPKDVTLLGKFPTVQSIVEHAIGNSLPLPAEHSLTLLGCLLVAEHSYFLMQHGNHLWGEVLALAVEEYQTSNIQPTISKAVKVVFHDCNGDMDGLCEGIIKVIAENCMSNKLLMRPVASSA
ncbi:hypothetical protein EDD16DRAFT_1898926 [Pisolithus croceorrhizus]|nr:hypothetical protein EDD16DRAFT_1898926 [Pisolithus croceorrhizus]KAI6143170.1 hypothetical protein EDD17DRAFT_1880437 [Pisolithus thermaeus]